MIKTGIDIVNIKRMARFIENPLFLKKVFDDSEIQLYLNKGINNGRASGKTRNNKAKNTLVEKKSGSDQNETFSYSEAAAAGLAGIYALKEAFFKATQAKIKKWPDLIVKKHESGKPFIVFDESLLDFRIKSIDCSISHDSEYAVACVVIEAD